MRLADGQAGILASAGGGVVHYGPASGVLASEIGSLAAALAVAGVAFFEQDPGPLGEHSSASSQLDQANTPAVDRDLAAWIQGGGLSAGLWLRDLRAVDDPQPGAIGLLAQDLQA
ncbi:MAG TPA: hypothetical protein VGS06_06740, partial [Streptosporangiaceae bacterium]|nr:hypothetical protein [Streptosporangiaceae bacterium]